MKLSNNYEKGKPQTTKNNATEGKTLTLSNTADYEDITDETELIIPGETKRIYVQSKDGSNVITVNNDIIEIGRAHV